MLGSLKYYRNRMTLLLEVYSTLLLKKGLYFLVKNLNPKNERNCVCCTLDFKILLGGNTRVLYLPEKYSATANYVSDDALYSFTVKILCGLAWQLAWKMVPCNRAFIPVLIQLKEHFRREGLVFLSWCFSNWVNLRDMISKIHQKAPLVNN